MLALSNRVRLRFQTCELPINASENSNKDGYRSAFTGLGGPDDNAWRALIAAFVIDKALYEIRYELDHRPEWVRVPLIGIGKLIG